MQDVADEDPVGIFGDLRILKLGEDGLNVLYAVTHDFVMNVTNHLRFGVGRYHRAVLQRLGESKREVS